MRLARMGALLCDGFSKSLISLEHTPSRLIIAPPSLGATELPATSGRLFPSSYAAYSAAAEPQRVPQEQPPEQGGESSSGSNSSNSSAGGSGSGAGASAEDVKQRVYSSFQSGFHSFKSGAAGVDGKGLINEWSQEIKEVFGAGTRIQSVTRKYTGPVADPSSFSGEAALVLVKQQQTAWQRLQDQILSFPLFSKMQGLRVEDTAAYKRGQELVADLKEKYENSDHPIVHKVEEVKERLMSGSESSRAMKEIRARDPTFDMNSFVRAIKLDAPIVTQAFLKHDLGVLDLHCGPELLERFRGIFTHFTSQGQFDDPTILFVGDVEVVEVRQMDDDPFIITQFHCQQLKCTRDKFGNVTDGSTNSIQRVYYFWGLQQEKVGVVTADGQLLPPRWVIRDMMWQSMLALV
ncbi:hypothetical protein V8C86DRAFT_2573456 [Haematococcus lacustris]